MDQRCGACRSRIVRGGAEEAPERRRRGRAGALSASLVAGAAALVLACGGGGGSPGGPTTPATHDDDTTHDPADLCTMTLAGAVSRVLRCGANVPWAWADTSGNGGLFIQAGQDAATQGGASALCSLGLGFPGAPATGTFTGAESGFGTITLIVNPGFSIWSVDAAADPPVGSYTFTVTALTNPQPRPAPYYGTTYTPHGTIHAILKRTGEGDVTLDAVF